MSERDFIIIYVKEFSLSPEEYDGVESHIKEVNEDGFTKIILVPSEITEKVERL